jgi:cytosine deaminase
MTYTEFHGLFCGLTTSQYALAMLRAPAELVEAPASRLPVDAEGLASFDLVVADGRIESIAPPGSVGGALSAGNRIVLPCFVDVHTHLDMGHMVDDWPNREGTHFGAVKARGAFREAALSRGNAWWQEDVERRMEFGLRCAYAHGTAAARTHLDSRPQAAEVTWRAFERVRERWRGKVELQGATLLPIDNYLGDYGRELADRVAKVGGVIGGVTRLSGRAHGDFDDDAPMRHALERIFVLAAERELDVDLHVDESHEPSAKNLDAVARARLAMGFKGRVVCGHCCSLSVRPEEEARAALSLCREAGLTVVSLPHVNLYLQDRGEGRTPRWRGVSLLQELHAAGVPVALGTDDVRDYFYAYGDHDLFAVLRDAVLIGHLDRPLGDWPAAVSRTPARMMGLSDVGVLAAGAAADFLIFPARRYSELLARAHSDRTLVRSGRVCEVTPPDYAELD